MKMIKYFEIQLKELKLSTIRLIFLGYLLFICTVILMKNLNVGNALFGPVSSIQHVDKFGHFFLFGIMTYLLSFTLKHKSFQLMTIRIPMAPVIMLLATFMEECSQIIQEFRTFSLLDMLANLLGIVCFGYLANWFSKKKILKVDL